MKNKVLIKIYNINIYDLTKYLFNKKIEFYNILENKNYVTLYIDKDNLDKIQILNYKIIKDMSIKNTLLSIKNKIYYIFLFLFAIILFNVLTNIIISININSSNIKLVNDLIKSLDNYKISRLSFKKDYIQIQNIKKKLLDEYKDKIEWLEIENIGMTYNIKLEERKLIDIQKDEGICDIVAKDNGYVTKILSSKGVVLTKNNKLVKEGDILISGHIKLNEEEKKSVCAKGLVYAEKWYTINIEIPKKYIKKEYTNKKRYNLLFELDNRDYKIFKSRLQNYDEDKEEIISLLNKKIYLIKEYEYKNIELEYDENSLNKRIDELIIEKLELNLNDKEQILQKNILKKDENDSRIKIEIFVTIEKLISKQVSS